MLLPHPPQLTNDSLILSTAQAVFSFALMVPPRLVRVGSSESGSEVPIIHEADLFLKSLNLRVHRDRKVKESLFEKVEFELKETRDEAT